MRRILGIASIKEDEIKQRVAALHKKYPEFKFEAVPHDTRTEFAILNSNSDMSQPLMEKMLRTAKGLDPVTEDVPDSVTK